jgi:MFS family permease
LISTTLFISLISLLAISLFGRHFVNLPKNIWLLFLAQPLAMSSAPMIVFAGGLVATKIAPDPELATLPLTMMILGTASAVIPASMLMKNVGRRIGTMIGLSAALIGALLCAYATYTSHFILLVTGSVFLGASMAFVAQMRFAAIESLQDPIDAPKAISVLMIGGMFAAIIGPEVAVIAKDWIDSPHGFTGSFLALSLLILVSIFVINLLTPTEIKQQSEEQESRRLGEIIKQPIFIIAVCSGAIAYSVMSYIMTAAPLSMHEVEGHDLDSTKWVIQSHIIAMYLPSLFSAFLIRTMGIVKLMLMGCAIYCLVVVIALSGKDILHYWWTMVLLGIGWNFLFTSGTLLLPQVYRDNERFKVQASNDFTIFFVQAMASLSAGLILFSQGWSILIKISIPVILIMFIVSTWYFMILRKEKK